MISSFCNFGECVDVRHIDGFVQVAHSASLWHSLTFTAEEWNAFLAGARAGEFDILALTEA